MSEPLGTIHDHRSPCARTQPELGRQPRIFMPHSADVSTTSHPRPDGRPDVDGTRMRSRAAGLSSAGPAYGSRRGPHEGSAVIRRAAGIRLTIAGPLRHRRLAGTRYREL